MVRRGGRDRALVVSATDEGSEFVDGLGEGEGLGIELFGRAGAFLGTGGIGLGDLVHLADGGVDLGEALSLLLGAHRGVGGDLADVVNLGDDVFEALGELGVDLDAALALGDGVGDFVGGFLGGLGGALAAGFLTPARCVSCSTSSWIT